MAIHEVNPAEAVWRLLQQVGSAMKKAVSPSLLPAILLYMVLFVVAVVFAIPTIATGFCAAFAIGGADWVWGHWIKNRK